MVSKARTVRSARRTQQSKTDNTGTEPVGISRSRGVYPVKTSHVGILSSMLAAFIRGLIWAGALATVLCAVVFLLESAGFIGKLNALLGGFITLSAPKLYMVSIMASICLLVICSFAGLVNALAYNLTGLIMGGVKTRLEMED